MISTYLSYQLYAKDLSKSLQRTANETQVAREQKYYLANIGKVKSVDDFLGDHRLYAYAMKAYGLESMTYAKAFMKKVLESDLGNASSFANKLSDSRYRDFARAFNFAPDGTLTNTAQLQVDDQEFETIGLYTRQNAAAQTTTSVETAYFQNHIGGVASVTDLLSDDRLYSYALKAVGLDPAIMSRAAVTNALTSDLGDPSSAAHQLGGKFVALAQLFNFAADGTVKPGYTAQSASQTASTVGGYANRSDAGVSDTMAALVTKYYENHIGSVKSVDDLLSNNTLYNYALTAYGIDPSTVSKATIRQVLESDLSDKNSYANRLGDSRFQNLAAAFNFAADGSIATRRMIQSVSGAIKTVMLYDSRIASDVVSKNAAKAETDYYKAHIGEVRTLDDFLNDKRLTDYALKAYNLADANVSKAVLRKILTSDLADPKSYANQLGDSRYRDLVAAFNVGTDGTIDRDAPRQAQSKKDAITTADMYVRQTMEAEAGDTNEGVRLALYFARKAPSISSVYEILADKALLQVVQTTFGFSSTTSAAAIDVQAAMISKKLNIADLKDPEKLNKLLVRFSAMYDMNNGTATTSSPLAILLGRSQSTSGIDPTLLAGMQQLKLGR